MSATRLGIIGFGRFGKLAARIINAKFKDTKVLVFARKKPLGKSEAVEFVSLEEVCECNIVIPCVPISAFEDIIKTISPMIKPGALVVDVSSVKVYPVEIMMKYLPKNIEILATHPIFGPDSARRGLKGLRIVLHNVSTAPERYRKTKTACERLGLEVVEMTPGEHDKLMAYAMAYTHLVGRIGERMGIKNTIIDTRGFAKLMEIQSYVTSDTISLFKDMHKFNPYAGEMRRRFHQALADIEAELSR